MNVISCLLKNISVSLQLSRMTSTLNQELFNNIKLLAPLCLAESWDNVGMLMEPENEIKINRIMLTNDLTIEVLDEVIEKKANMIISYHPPLFHGFKRLRKDHWKELIVSRCIKHNLYVYSPHTALDSVNGGVNDWLLSVFDIENKYPVQEYKGELEQECSKSTIGDEKIQHGGGRICTLRHPLSIKNVIDKLKIHLKMNNLMLARSRNHNLEDPVIKSVAVCVGSGASVLKSCVVAVDLWITGEMSHHELLDVTEKIGHSTSVVLTAGHSNSERGYLSDVMQPWLTKHLAATGIEVFVSHSDHDPLSIV